MANVQIVITSKNGTKQTFDMISADANAMAGTLEGAGARSAVSMEKVGRKIGDVALAFGAFSLVAGKIAGDAEASTARLDTAFTNAGLAVTDYQDKITQLTSTGLKLAFDDEDVQDALARLVTVTGDVQKSFKDVGLAEDIARAQGISLASATQLVVAAENGRFRGLAALGVAIDATSTKESVLADAQAKFSGQAAAYATTGAATFDRYKNSAENALESIGGKLEGLQMPIIALSTAGAALGPLAGSIKEMAASGLLLDAALGPVGLAAAALAAGAGIFYLFSNTEKYTSAASAAVTQSIDLNNALVILASTSSPTNATIIGQLNDDIKTLLSTSGAAEDHIAGLTDLMSRMGPASNVEGGALRSLSLLDEEQVKAAASITGMTEAQLHALDANNDTVVTYNEMKDAINGVIPALSSLAGLSHSLSTPEMDKFTADFKTLIELPNANIPAISAAVEGLVQQFESGAISSTDFVKGMDALTADVSPFVLSINAATTATDGNTTAVNASAQAIADQMDLYDSQNKSLSQAIDFTTANTAAVEDDTAAREANGRAIAAQMIEYDAQNQSLDKTINQARILDSLGLSAKFSQSMAVVRDTLVGVKEATDAGIPATKEFTDDLSAQVKAAIDAQSALSTYAGQLGQLPALYGDHAANFARGQNVANDALGSGYQAIVGNTNAISDQIEGIRKWAVELINVQGEYGNIDDLLQAGLINQKEYNDAQAAGNVIFRAASEIEDDMAAIQAKQAPIIAELSANEEAYLNHLADLPPQMQLVRLGYMDTAESAKALAAEQLAAQAAAGGLGKAGEESATKIITGAAEADPVLKAMLEDMGLISEGADGTITVDFGSVSDASDETKVLINAMDRLSSDLEKIYKLGIDSSEAITAATDVGTVTSAVDLLDGKRADVKIGADTSDYFTAVSGLGLGTILGTAFVHVAAIVDPAVLNPSSGEPPIGGSGGESHLALGGVTGYAGGGAVRAMLAEYDPELVHLAGGGVAIARHKGIYDVPRGSYVDTAPMARNLLSMAGGHTFDFRGATFLGEKDDIIDAVIGAVSDSLVGAAGQHFAGHGVRG